MTSHIIDARQLVPQLIALTHIDARRVDVTLPAISNIMNTLNLPNVTPEALQNVARQLALTNAPDETPQLPLQRARALPDIAELPGPAIPMGDVPDTPQLPAPRAQPPETPTLPPMPPQPVPRRYRLQIHRSCPNANPSNTRQRHRAQPISTWPKQLPWRTPLQSLPVNVRPRRDTVRRSHWWAYAA